MKTSIGAGHTPESELSVGWQPRAEALLIVWVIRLHIIVTSYMLRVHSTHRCANQSEWIKLAGSQRIHLAWNDHKPFLTESDETMSWEILDKLNKRMNIKKLFLELGAKMHLSMIFSNYPLTIIQPHGNVGKVWSHLTVIAPACNLVKTAHPQRK